MSSGLQDALSWNSPISVSGDGLDTGYMVLPTDQRWTGVSPRINLNLFKVEDEYKPNWWDEDTEHTHHEFDWLNQKPAPKCECGVWATYGKEYPKHLEYCPIYSDRFDLKDWWPQ